jgi:hypothetical protein
MVSGVGGISLSAGAVARIGSINNLTGSVNVDASSTLWLAGSTSVNQFHSTGTLELHGSHVSAWTFSQSGGRLTATNSWIDGDVVEISGGPHTFVNSSVGPGLAAQYASVGGATFIGPHASANIREGTGIFGTVLLRDGATAGGSIPVHGTLVIGDGCSTGWLRLYENAVVRVAGRARVNGLMFYAGGRLEVALDALQLPSAPPVTFYAGDGSGPLVVEIANANALRVGDSAPLVADSPSGARIQFSQVQLPALPGGRALAVTQTPAGYELRVITGGSDPCWTSDFNGDEHFGTDQDIEAFFACLAGNCCPTCGTADFNSDGDFGTDQDIEAFFRILSGAPC